MLKASSQKEDWDWVENSERTTEEINITTLKVRVKKIEDQVKRQK